MINGFQVKWRPISTLHFYSDNLDRRLADMTQKLEVLLSVKNRPHVIDEGIIVRILTVYSEQQKSLSYYRKLASHWAQETKSQEECVSIDFFNSQIGEIDKILKEILFLTEKLSPKTFQRVLNEHCEASISFTASVASSPFFTLSTATVN